MRKLVYVIEGYEGMRVTHCIKVYLLGVCALLGACTSIPKGLTPVENFEKERYLGKWYEIARLDHSFERGLSKVTTEYSLNDNGSIRVQNKGFSAAKGEWDDAEGKAYFVGKDSVGHLKVSFYGPFYASYVIIELDTKDYKWALVSGQNRDYLWILARSPILEQSTRDKLVNMANGYGFAVEDLIFVKH